MNFLESPYPLELEFKKNLKLSFLVGFFVFFFLFFFQPAKAIFSLKSMSLTKSINYGFVTFLVMLFFYQGLIIIFPKVFDESKWTIKKSILHNSSMIFTIALFNILLDTFFISNSFAFSNFSKNFFEVLFITFSVSLFPVIAIIFYNQNVLLKKYLEETESINASLISKKITKEITIKGKGKNENFDITLSKILFIKSIGNYCEIYISETNKPLILRNSLNNLLAQIGEDKIYKCHRSYLVNLKNVIHISGDAQGLKLHFKNTDSKVPVSRSLTKEIKELLLNRS